MTGLEAVRERHLAAAHAQAELILEESRQQARTIVAGGDADAAGALDTARREGEAMAGIDTGRAWTATRRRARSLILAAQRDAYDELWARIALAIRRDARYPALLEQLGGDAQRRLGPGSVLEIDHDGDRGVVATRKNRRVEWSLEEIAGTALDELGPGAAELWR